VKELVKMVLPFCLLALLPLMTSCDEIQSPDIDDILSEDDEQEESAGDALQITDIHFSDDYKEMELSTRLLHDVGGQDLTDSTKVVYTVEQHVKRLINKLGKESQPVITKVSNSSRDLFNSLKIRLLVLVDLSLPQQQVDAQCKAVKEMRALFGEENLFIAFMQGDNVSETYQATDYIINNYFVHQDPSFIYLYRSVVTKLAEMQDKSTTIGNATRKVMIILSGGKTYNGELPVDPKHFELEELLNNRAQTVDGMMRVYYANFSSTTSSTDGGPEQLIALSENVTDNNVLQYFCKASDGLYQSSFSWQQMEEDILKDYNIDLSNYKITLEQPDRKVFRGDIHVLEVAFHDKATGDLIAKGQTEFSLGSVYSPVVVRDGPMIEFVMSGILFTLFLLLIVWLIFQFLEPYIRYRIFKKKYVITYTGSQMSYQGEPVSESCYLCKAPFKAGDEIVVKCKHTMHKECWDDNEYHCPEHGRHCKEGSHFYNQHELLDPRNALFYMKWVLVAIVAGFTAWCVFVTRDHPVSSEMIEYLKSVFDKSKVDNIFGSGSGLSDLPAFGQAVGFLLTFFLANFTVSHRQWYYRLCEILLRSFIASFVGCLLCLLGCLISVMLHFNYSTFLTEWIPWALLSGFIMLAVTFKTCTPIRRSFILASLLIAVLTMFIWAFVYYNSLFDYRVSLLMGFIFYTVAIALCIAYVSPRSERYFLHVEGAIKEMDIALYKWFKVSPKQVLSIGKSVDCTIQLSWDINGRIAPLHAEIRRVRDSLRFKALEEGVTLKDGKPLAVGKEIWLYHGKSFTIGNTTFTYIEKDV
jgi:hypothetical protein